MSVTRGKGPPQIERYAGSLHIDPAIDRARVNPGGVLVLTSPELGLPSNFALRQH